MNCLVQPFARYFPAMDFLLYVKEDCSYREDRIDGGLTLLWHPHDDRAVGIRIKGYKCLYQTWARVMRAQGLDAEKKMPFVSLIAALELAMLNGAGDARMKDAERKRIEEGYECARQLLQDAPKVSTSACCLAVRDNAVSD